MKIKDFKKSPGVLFFLSLALVGCEEATDGPASQSESANISGSSSDINISDPDDGSSSDTSSSGSGEGVQAPYLLGYWNQILAADSTILDNDENAALAVKMADNGRSKLAAMVDSSDFADKGEIFAGRSLFNPDSTVDDIELRATFLDLQHMAVLVSLPDTSAFSNGEYKDADVIARLEGALTYLLNNVYTKGSAHTGNWWNWEIGANASLINIASMLKDELSAELMAQIIEVSRYMSPDPRTIFDSEGTDAMRRTEPSLGANRVDLVELNIVRASLDGKVAEIENAMTSLYEIFEFVDNGDGFYEDGSVIQHVDIPYNGGYGSVIIDGIARIQYAATKAGYVTDSESNAFLYEMIFNNFEPVLYKSQIIEGVRGRGASRGWNRGRKEAQSVIQSMLMLYSVAPAEYREKLGSLIKEQLLSPDADRPRYTINEFANMNVPLYIANHELMNNDDIEPRGVLEGNFLLAKSDRVIHRKDGWLFSISAFSDRIGNYECINGENLLGYNTANGMTYIYDGDQEQYVNYWPVMNPILPAGTTGNITDKPEDCSELLAGNERKSTMSWVGGVSSRNKYDFDGSYGAFGMNFESYDDNVKIYKSWFMFDNEVVALGSNLDASSNKNTQTAVEFRKIQSNAINKIFIDNVPQPTGKTALDYAGQPDRIFIAGDKYTTSSRGYIFPDKQDVILERTIELTADWKDHNIFNETRMSKSDVKYNTVDIKIDHAKNDGYSYIILPVTSPEKVEAYYNAPDVEIKENSADVHWVVEKGLSLQAANIWSEDGASRSDFEVDKPASLMIQTDTSGGYNIWIASPVRANKVINLTIPTIKENMSIGAVSDTAAITQASNTEFTIDFSGREGQTVLLHLDND